MNYDELDKDELDQLDDFDKHLRWTFKMNLKDKNSRLAFKMNIWDEYSRWTFEMIIQDKHSRWTSWGWAVPSSAQLKLATN